MATNNNTTNPAWLSMMQGIGTITNSYYQGQAAKSQYDYQAQVSEQNSKLALIKAEDALRRGGKEADQIRNQTKKVIGTQRSGFASQNVDVDYGVAQDIQAETAALGAENALTVENNAWREAWGYKVEAATGMQSAEFSRQAGTNVANNTLLSGGLNAIGYGANAYYLTNSRKKDSTGDS